MVSYNLADNLGRVFIQQQDLTSAARCR